MRPPVNRRLTLILLVTLMSHVHAVTIHVGLAGDDRSGDGSEGRPYRTISRAAQQAQSGDIVLVQAGIYRERVAPPRGGTDAAPITYRAAPGAQVRICGSEAIERWTRGDGGVHVVELPVDHFVERNPYATRVDGPYMTYGKWHSLGQVYLDNVALIEVTDVAAVQKTPRSWHAIVDAQGATRIVANFGGVDPAASLVEINHRSMVFAPEQAGCDHIVVDGFVIAQAANAWAAPNRTQEGAIWPHLARHWVIRNCLVEHARCVGISLGKDEGWPELTKDNVGHHRVERCVIRFCGEAGVVGLKASSFSVIEGCLIEHINPLEEFGGWETAGIKVHLCVDLVIRGNLIRHIHWGDELKEGFCRESGFGIWIDYACQNVRITGNVIGDTEGECIDLEKNYGPVLVDNNVLLDRGAISINGNEASVWAHNLFIGGTLSWWKNDNREVSTWKPHTLAGDQATGRPADIHHQVRNNVFIGAAHLLPPGDGNLARQNLFLDGARPSALEVEAVDAAATAVHVAAASDADGVRLTLTVPKAWTGMTGTPIDAASVGVFTRPRQGLAHPDGSPLAIDTDLTGARRDMARPRVGPLERLEAGERTIVVFTAAGLPGR